jgi:hypothetical protein
MAAVRRRVATSRVVSRGLALLSSLNLGPRTPERHLLFTTRVMLRGLIEDEGGRIELARWLRESPPPVTVRVAQDFTASECWAEYEKEAIAAVDDFRACLKSKSWYDWFGREGCELIYDLRAIAAAAWLIKCVSPYPG